jgi:DNA-binding transcriptional regulator YiaG
MNETETNKVTYLTVNEYASWVNVTIKTVYNWIESGKIPKGNIKTVLNTTLIKKEFV